MSVNTHCKRKWKHVSKPQAASEEPGHLTGHSDVDSPSLVELTSKHKKNKHKIEREKHLHHKHIFVQTAEEFSKTQTLEGRVAKEKEVNEKTFLFCLWAVQRYGVPFVIP